MEGPDALRISCWLSRILSSISSASTSRGVVGRDVNVEAEESREALASDFRPGIRREPLS